MKVKSFKTKLWLYFALFTAIIFLLLWLLQTVFLQGFYNQMLMNSTRKAAETIIQNADSENITEIVDGIAHSNSLLIYITDKDGSVIYISDEYKNAHNRKHMNAENGSLPADSTPDEVRKNCPNKNNSGKNKQHGGNYRSLPSNYDMFLKHLQESENGVTEYTNDSLYVYGAYIDYYDTEGKSVLYISATLNAVGSTVTIIRMQLAIVTVFSLLFGFVLAWFIARKFAKPVSQLSGKAKTLGEKESPDGFQKGFCAELDELNDTLDETSEKLRQSKNFQHELLANVSHDLRTPLTMIKGYAESVSDMGDDEKQRQADAAIIIREADRLTALVNEILEYSELQTDGNTEDFEVLSFSKLVGKVADNFEALYKREGGNIERCIDDAVQVRGSSGRLERAVYNLIDNAVRHTGDSKKITVALHAEDGNAVLRVTDYGCGIPEEQLDAIWERYNTSRQRKGKGVSGLGLAIVRQVVTLHGGSCRVQSVEGEGSTFILTVPLY